MQRALRVHPAAALAGVGLAALPCLIPREARLAQPVQAVIRFVIDVMHANAARVAGTPECLQVPAPRLP